MYDECPSVNVVVHSVKVDNGKVDVSTCEFLVRRPLHCFRLVVTMFKSITILTKKDAVHYFCLNEG